MSSVHESFLSFSVFGDVPHVFLARLDSLCYFVYVLLWALFGFTSRRCSSSDCKPPGLEQVRIVFYTGCISFYIEISWRYLFQSIHVKAHLLQWDSFLSYLCAPQTTRFKGAPFFSTEA